MNTVLRLLCLCSALMLATGCASDGSMWNPFSDDDEYTDTTPYYFSEFSDVPIPNEMSESSGDTFISFAPSGVKIGVQRFSGRLELVALMNALRQNMANNGWTLRSLLRSNKSFLVFEKQNRICSMVISDGLIYTSMQIFVSPRLEGDSSALDISAYTPAPVRHSGDDSSAPLTE